MGAGLTDAGRHDLRAVAERYVGDTLVPGLVTLVARGEDVHLQPLGS
jgi:hypothetical protein